MPYIRRPLYILIIALALLTGGCGGCGGPTVTEMRLCEKIKGGRCPEPFTMFVRNQRVLYFSALPDGVPPGSSVKIDLHHQPAPGVSKSIHKAGARTGAADKPFAVPMRLRRLPIGAYALKVSSSADGFRDRTLRFNVFRTRREIRERLKLGNKSGTVFKKFYVCASPNKKPRTCKKDHTVLPRGTGLFLIYYEVEDSLAGSGLRVEWRSMRGPHGRNRLLGTSKVAFKEAGGHTGRGHFGYVKQDWSPGSYRIVVTASRSKSAPIIKDFRVR